MLMGERFIERKIEGNKIIRIFEFKEFPNMYEDIAQEINDYITDDCEELYYKGIAIGFDEMFSITPNSLLDWVEEMIEEDKKLEEREREFLDKFIEPLKEAGDFTIYFNSKKDEYETSSSDKTNGDKK